MSTTPEDFITMGAFGKVGFSGSCVPKMNVKPSADDPSDPDYNGIVAYKAFTLDEAMKIYWLMKDIDMTGSGSVTASSSGSGSYARYVREAIPGTNPKEYRIVKDDEWSAEVTAGPISGSTTMVHIPNTNLTNDPTPPQNRICDNWSRLVKNFEMEGISESESDSAPSDSSREISCQAFGTLGQLYYHSHGYGDGDNAYGYASVPPTGLRRFYDGDTDDEDNFVGFGFTNAFVSGECVVFCSASSRPPSFVTYDFDDVHADISMGGFFHVGCLVYTEEFGQWYGTGQHTSVSFGGFNMLAGGGGTDDFNISGTSAGVKFSFSDSDNCSPSFSADTRDEDGAGETFSGSGQGDISGSFEILMKNPDFWEY